MPDTIWLIHRVHVVISPENLIKNMSYTRPSLPIYLFCQHLHPFYFFGILIGEEIGRYLIYISKNIIVKISTIIASLALFIGILHLYITKKHYLRIKD